MVVVRISYEPLAGSVMLLLAGRGSLGPWRKLWPELGCHAGRPTVGLWMSHFANLVLILMSLIFWDSEAGREWVWGLLGHQPLFPVCLAPLSSRTPLCFQFWKKRPQV